MGRVIKKEHVWCESGAVEGEKSLPMLAGKLPKNARLVRLDGDVHALEFTCSCGERSLIEFEYEPRSGAEAAKHKPRK